MKTDIKKLNGEKPIEQSDIGITIYLDVKDTIQEVNNEMIKHIGYCLKLHNNVYISIFPQIPVIIINCKNTFNVSEGIKTNISPALYKKPIRFDFIQEIDVKDVIQTYSNEWKENPDLTPYLAVAEQITLMVSNFYFRNGDEHFFFAFNKEKETMLLCGEKNMENNMVGVVTSIRSYNLNKSGSFLKKEWILADPTSGGGKYER